MTEPDWKAIASALAEAVEAATTGDQRAQRIALQMAHLIKTPLAAMLGNGPITAESVTYDSGLNALDAIAAGRTQEFTT